MMIPITRKEKYINEIVGGGNTAPETPQTREESFFADILGEVIAPSPVTRIEKYLSAIAGQYSGDLPTPTTRIEYFLAKAAGMEIETPIPITREEMLWDTYIPIKTIEGIPPLTFKAKKAGTLKNYRIYGQTVDGESVGDRTGNLFDINSPLLYNASISKLNAEINTDMFPYGTGGSRQCIFIPVEPNTTYTFSCRTAGDKLVIATYNQRYTKAQLDLYTTDNCLISDGEIIFDLQKGYTLYTFTTPATTNMIGIYYQLNISPTGIMLNEGSTALPYEPFGYKVPVTVEGKNLLNPNLTRFAYAINGASYFTPYENAAVYLIPIKNNTAYTIKVYSSETMPLLRLGLYNKSSPISGDYVTNLQEALQTTSPSLTIINTTYKYLVVQISSAYSDKYGLNNLMLNTGSTALPYEPYHAPVTTPIYLPEQIRKVGDEAEYVDYKEQKQHFADGTSADVELPALPTIAGTNTLTVGTEVQPSNVYIKYEGAQ